MSAPQSISSIYIQTNLRSGIDGPDKLVAKGDPSLQQLGELIAAELASLPKGDIASSTCITIVWGHS